MGDDRVPGQSTSRPLLDTRPDMTSRYLERGVDSALTDGIGRGLNILLEGARGSGKTSTLNRQQWLARQKPASEKRHLLIPARRAEHPADFLFLLLTALGHDTPPKQPDLTDSRPPGEDEAFRGRAWRELATTQGALELLRARMAELDREVVFLVDDIDPQLGHQVFGVLRDDLWSLPAQWVVTVAGDGVAALLEPPADAFFDLRLELSPLTRAEGLDLLRMRTGHDLAIPDRDWQPRELLKLALTVDPSRWEDLVALQARQQSQIAALGRPAAMLAEVLRSLGPVSPSDERVLEATGWTRSRVSQVLKQLMEAGHVTYTEAASGRAGRPARVYRLLEPGGPS